MKVVGSHGTLKFSIFYVCYFCQTSTRNNPYKKKWEKPCIKKGTCYPSIFRGPIFSSNFRWFRDHMLVNEPASGSAPARDLERIRKRKKTCNQVIMLDPVYPSPPPKKIYIYICILYLYIYIHNRFHLNTTSPFLLFRNGWTFVASVPGSVTGQWIKYKSKCFRPWDLPERGGKWNPGSLADLAYYQNLHISG